MQPVGNKAAELGSKIPMTKEQAKIAALLAAQLANSTQQTNKDLP
jgi:hypothetical protein